MYCILVSVHHPCMPEVSIVIEEMPSRADINIYEVVATRRAKCPGEMIHLLRSALHLCSSSVKKGPRITHLLITKNFLQFFSVSCL